MAPHPMVCLFCFDGTNDGFPTSGSLAIAENARQIIGKHFWFDVSLF